MFDCRLSQPCGCGFRSQYKRSISEGDDKIKTFPRTGSQVNQGNAIIRRCVLLLLDLALLAAL